MSIIVALISNRDGVVASDGRRFGSAHVNVVGDQVEVVQAAQIETEECDKTFSLGNGRIIGASCGLMSFSGLSIGEHIEELAETAVADQKQLADVAELIAEGIAAKLHDIKPDEVMWRFRSMDILLVGGKRLTRAEMSIASIRIYPEEQQISHRIEIIQADRLNKYWI